MGWKIDDETGERRFESDEDQTALTNTPDLSRLDGMDREGLISLIQRMARQCGMVACTSEEELRQAFLDRMAHIGLTAKAAEALAAIEKRMDRVEGKAMQRQQSLVAIADANKPLPENDAKALEHYFRIKGITNNA